MLAIISGTNRPESNPRKVTQQIEEIYGALKVPQQVLDLAKMPLEIFLPSSYAEKPAGFRPFADAVLQADGQGRLNDTELVGRLQAQAAGFVDFVGRLQGVKLRQP